jgi:phosphatidylglycerophosphate synthase
LGKISTFFQICFVLLVLIHAAVPDYKWLLWLEAAALVLTAIFTAASGLDYVRKGIIMTRQPPVPNEEYVISSRRP